MTTLTGTITDVTGRAPDSISSITVKAPSARIGVGTDVIVSSPAEVTFDKTTGDITLSGLHVGLSWLYIEGDGWSDSIPLAVAEGFQLILEAVANASGVPGIADYVLMIRNSESHALLLARAAVDGEIGEVVRLAQAAATTAAQAATSAENKVNAYTPRVVALETDFMSVESTAGTALSTAQVANSKATTAASRATSAENKVDSYTPRVEALEAMGGLSTESPVDGQTASLIEQPETLTRAALASHFAQVGADGKLVGGTMPQLSLAASPATGVSVTTSPQMRVMTYFDGAFVGFQDGRLYTSQDGSTWADAGPSPLGQIPGKIVPTLDGEIMCAISPSLHRSSGWGTGTLSWSKKMDVTPGAGIQPFGFNGRNGKFIVTEYSGERATSRYAYISTDDGQSFTQVWDSNEMHGPVDGPLTHIHGVEYDHYADRFYLSEGHLAASAGLYVSVDDGATWMRPPGLFEDPSPTTVDVTPDGLVCGSDSGRAGILGVVRQDNPMDEKFIHTWVWQTGKDGVVGFGASSFRDEATGIVYIGFRAGQTGVHPVIAGGTPTAAGLVWEWDGGPSAISDDVRNPVVVNGRLYAHGLLSGQSRTIRGFVASPGVPSSPSQVRVVGTKMESGVGASATGMRNLAVGNDANAAGVQDSIAVGYGATSGNNALAVGARAVAESSSTAVGWQSKTVPVGNQVAVGYSASTSGGESAAVGAAATAGSSSASFGNLASSTTSSVAIGNLSKSGTSSVAVGRQADASVGDNSVAVGREAKTTAGWGTAVGSNSSSASSGAALGREADAAANGVSVGRLATSASSGIAIGREASAGQDMIAIGRGATSEVGGAISIGHGVAATSSNSVAFGARGIHLQPVTTTPVAPQGGGILYIRDIGGVLSLCVRMAGGAEIVIAPASAPAV